MNPAWWLVGAGLALAAGIACWPMITGARQGRLMRRRVPPEWPAILRRRAPVCARLPKPLAKRLYRHMQVFLADKHFYGCDGLEVTEEMRVTIAGLACLLTLNRGPEGHQQVNAILLYPDAFVVRREETDEAGVRWSEVHALSGESWDSGRVVLSWADVCAGSEPSVAPYNVVLHEFAHQLDSESGHGDGAPALASGREYAEWADVLGRAFEALRSAVAQGHRPDVMDEYAAETPAEFFAVATETFFERPHALREQYSELYALFERYFGLDPAGWTPSDAARDDTP